MPVKTVKIFIRSIQSFLILKTLKSLFPDFRFVGATDIDEANWVVLEGDSENVEIEKNEDKYYIYLSKGALNDLAKMREDFILFALQNEDIRGLLPDELLTQYANFVNVTLHRNEEEVQEEANEEYKEGGMENKEEANIFSETTTVVIENAVISGGDNEDHSAAIAENLLNELLEENEENEENEDENEEKEKIQEEEEQEKQKEGKEEEQKEQQEEQKMQAEQEAEQETEQENVMNTKDWGGEAEMAFDNEVLNKTEHVLLLRGTAEKPVIIFPKQEAVFVSIKKYKELEQLYKEYNYSYVIGNIYALEGENLVELSETPDISRTIGIISYDAEFNRWWQEVEAGSGKEYLLIKNADPLIVKLLEPHIRKRGYKIIALTTDIWGEPDEHAQVTEYKSVYRQGE